MLAPTALEANWWWVPREPLAREEVPPPVKRSPPALQIPSEREAGHSRAALVMFLQMVLEVDCWPVPREPLPHGELPSRAKAPVQGPWAQTKPEVQLPQPVQFRPQWRVPAAPPAELPSVQPL